MYEKFLYEHLVDNKLLYNNYNCCIWNLYSALFDQYMIFTIFIVNLRRFIQQRNIHKMRIIYRFTVYDFRWSFMESMSLLRKSQVVQTADFSLPLSWFKLSMQWMRFFNISYAFWSVWPVFPEGRMHSRLKNKHIKIIRLSEFNWL